MVVDSSASLAIYSDNYSAADVTAILGIEPTRAGEIGDPKHPSRIGRDGEVARQFFCKQSTWIFDVKEASDPDDESGTASIRRLVELFRDEADGLVQLRKNYQTIIWGAGHSDSSQCGFVIPADLLLDLGALGCGLFGTVYTNEDEEFDPGSPPITN